jgi:hypothetical protein
VKRALVTGRAITVEPPETAPEGRPFLYVDLEIDCDFCGSYLIRIAGHHLRPVIELLQEFLDAHDPALTESGDVQSQSRTRWRGTAPARPEDN